MKDDVIQEAMYREAMLIDRHLNELLAKMGIQFHGDIIELRKTLKDKGFEIIQEIRQELSANVYTLKICKIIDTNVFTIPKIII